MIVNRNSKVELTRHQGKSPGADEILSFDEIF